MIPFSLLAGIGLGACTFFSLGYALLGLIPSARAVVIPNGGSVCFGHGAGPML
jgi:hypothetical protein